MTSKPVSALLTDLGITRSHSRPRVSNDNPYSEAQFKTLKYVHDFLGHFDSLTAAKLFCDGFFCDGFFCDGFFTEYNHVHHHSGIAWHTPASVHYGTYEDIDDARQQILNRVYHQYPQRFNKPPRTPQIHNEAWINQPSEEATTTTEITEGWGPGTHTVALDLTNAGQISITVSMAGANMRLKVIGNGGGVRDERTPQ